MRNKSKSSRVTQFMKLAVLVVVALFLAGCGTKSDTDPVGPPPDADDIVSTVVDPSASPPPSGPREVRPDGGLTHVIPTAWEKAKVTRDGRSARLTWYSGVEECYGLDHVDVDYGKTTVTVTMYSGSRPEAEECIDLAERVVTIVDFDEPLAGRELVDGARID